MRARTAIAKRLTLSGRQVRRILDLSGGVLPPGFGPGQVPGVGDEEDAALLELGVLHEDGSLAPELALDLSLLATSQVSIEVCIDLPAGRQTAWLSVVEPWGMALVALADDGVEWSVFAATDLGLELIRLVPELSDPEAGDPLEPAQFPLAVMAQVIIPTALDGDQSKKDWATYSQALVGQGRFTVIGRSAEGPFVGLTLWYASNRGWIGVREVNSTVDDGPIMELIPVRASDIGTWLAGNIARAMSLATSQESGGADE